MCFCVFAFIFYTEYSFVLNILFKLSSFSGRLRRVDYFLSTISCLLPNKNNKPATNMNLFFARI